MDLFDEISENKKEFPKVKSIKREVGKQKLNFYQVFAIGLFIAFFFLGIVFGNLFATCKASSYYYSDTCLVTEFNFSLMIAIWFISLLISLFIYAIGHIVAILDEINEKLSKKWCIILAI